MSQRRALNLDQVKSLIEQGLSAAEIRIKLVCRRTTLLDFIRDHNLGVRFGTGKGLIEAAKPKPKSAPDTTFTTGGDAEFKRLMNGREYGRIIFKPSSNPPIHKPHKIPGEDHSTYGSSLRHDSGDTGRRAGGAGRS